MVDRRFAFVVGIGAATAALVACGSLTGLSDDYKFNGADAAASSSGGPGGDGSAEASAGDGGDAGTGTDGSALLENGCADGTRENFTDLAKYPKLAGCSGAWSIPGTAPTGSNDTPKCNRKAGNDGANQNGEGCSVEDLCADGWEVCRTATEFFTHGGNACEHGGSETFWATRVYMDTTATSCRQGSTETANNVVGCGTLGDPITGGLGNQCGSLDRFMQQSTCPSPWKCDSPLDEANTITKEGSDKGGVICCKQN